MLELALSPMHGPARNFTLGSTARRKAKRGEGCHFGCHFGVDPDSAYHFDADPDPTFQFDADPDPQHWV
jgi:hypothetical protein